MQSTETFTLTAAEQSFLYHFSRESCQHERGPAVAWLTDHGLAGGAMIAFQDWAERHDPKFLDRILNDPLPPFQLPWDSREELAARVGEIMDVYPDLKGWTSAQP